MKFLNDSPWHHLEKPEALATPALLVFPDRIQRNIDSLISMVGGAKRLQPHVKTHKMPEVVRMFLASGVEMFKCATIAEVEMVAACGATAALLAYQPTGPHVERLVRLTREYPNTRLSALIDNEKSISLLSDAFGSQELEIGVYMDVDVGMGRTGVSASSDKATAIYGLMAEARGVRLDGLHVYDGHIFLGGEAGRRAAFEAGTAAFDDLAGRIGKLGLPVPSIVAGGSPSFPFHAARCGQLPNLRCSPGTAALWDYGFGDELADYPFVHAALLATRVVSKPGEGKLCLDIGYKAVSAEKPPYNVRLIGLEDAQPVMQSEEHFVVETEMAGEYEIGDLLLGIPRHVCPTVALYDEAMVVKDGELVDRWEISARRRRITI